VQVIAPSQFFITTAISELTAPSFHYLSNQGWPSYKTGKALKRIIESNSKAIVRKSLSQQ
jgi:hypothetical protein